MWPDVIDIDKLTYLTSMAKSMSDARRLREAGAVWLEDASGEMVRITTRYVRNITRTTRPEDPS